MPPSGRDRDSASMEALADVAAGRSRDPFAVLGPHAAGPGELIVRTMQPVAAGLRRPIR